jgi:hypothetical protein
MNNLVNNFNSGFADLEGDMYDFRDLRMENWDALERDLLFETATKLPGDLKHIQQAQQQYRADQVASLVAVSTMSSKCPSPGLHPLPLPMKSATLNVVSNASKVNHERNPGKSSTSELILVGQSIKPPQGLKRDKGEGSPRGAPSSSTFTAAPLVEEASTKKLKLTPAEKKEKKLQAQIISKEKRRERNRILARKTRAKRKVELASLVEDVRALQKENGILRDLVTGAMPIPGDQRMERVERPSRRCCLFDGQIPEDIIEIVRKMSGLAGGPLSPDMAFCVTNALNVLNPIVYVSPGFVMLTGYPLGDILGKNCNILQGPETNPNDVRATYAWRQYLHI